MKHGILTVVAPIVRDHDRIVRQRLLAMGNGGLPTAPLIGLHFASASVLCRYPDAPDDFTPQLLFEASFDGPREDFVDDLVATGGMWLDTVFQDCEGYPPQGTQIPQLVKNYLFNHDKGADCVYIAYPYRSVGQIQQEHQLRDAVAGLDDIDRAALGQRHLPPPMKRSLVSLIRRQIATIPRLQGALTLPERPFVTTYWPAIADGLIGILATLVTLAAIPKLLRFSATGVYLTTFVLFVLSIVLSLLAVWRPRWKHAATGLLLAAALTIAAKRFDTVAMFLQLMDRVLAGLGVVLVVPVIVLIVVIILWILAIAVCERLDPEPSLPSWNARREEILRPAERLDAQNLLIGLNRIKPGWFRLLTLRFVLWTIHALKHLDKAGALAGVSSIHFARWTIIDRGRQLLFISHYDGDWDAYLGDFVEEASIGMTAIWSNCTRFPRSWFLFFGGTRDQRAFKAYARGSQHETLWVYRAYPHLTVSNIENHTAIREALGRPLEAAGLEELLRRL